MSEIVKKINKKKTVYKISIFEIQFLIKSSIEFMRNLHFTKISSSEGDTFYIFIKNGVKGKAF